MIQVYRGDDSDFADLNKIVLNIETELSLEGFTGCFCLLGVTREFAADEVARKTVSFTYTAEETAGFVPGYSWGVFTLFDPEGRKAAVQRVLAKVIMHRECSGTLPGEIAIRVENQFDYEAARNLPTLNGVTVKGDKTGEDYRLVDVPRLKEAFKDPSDVKLAPAALLQYLKELHTAIQGL